MNLQTFSRFFVVCAILAVAFAATAETRVLLVGDSWAAGMLGFQAFEKALAEVDEEAVVAGATTAIGGSRADQWAANHDGKLDTLREALADPLDVVVISLGGNDLLRAALAGQIETEAQRAALLTQVTRDLGILLDAIQGASQGMQVVIIGYDYIDPERMRETYGMEFPEKSAENLDLALDELEDARHAFANAREGVLFARNLGLLRATYGPEAPAAMPDGVHPSPEAYQLIAARAWEMVSWLLEQELAG